MGKLPSKEIKKSVCYVYFLKELFNYVYLTCFTISQQKPQFDLACLRPWISSIIFRLEFFFTKNVIWLLI